MFFEDEYQKLNSAQRQAVDAIDGPVLVIAGPGTGKTQLLSMRVANILQQTDTDAGSILCLTFTNKAAINMRERIVQLTGGKALGVNVKTFHSFAAELMNNYPDYFWNGARLSSAPDVVQLEIIQTILGRLPLDNPLALKFAGTFTAGKDVQNGLRLAKEAGLTPDKLRSLIAANLAYMDVIEPELIALLDKPLSYKQISNLHNKVSNLPRQGIDVSLQPLLDLGSVIVDSFEFARLQDEGTNKTKHIGAWKQRFVQTVDDKKGMFKERERNAWWLALADVYELYRNELHRRGFYDYSDMVVEVISQLQSQPNMRADVQEKFLYVLIDEFQDTNAAQLQLAHLIADHHQAGGNPNIMAVGDDDQSIYKFNGAELNNMLSFKTSYPNAQLIILTENYRSSSQILSTAENVISAVNDRLVNREPGLSKQLRSNYQPSVPGTIQGITYPNQDYELATVADSIAQDYQSGNTNIAVLARSHDSLRRLAAQLQIKNVPIRYEQQNNILDHPLVTQVYTLARLVLAISDGNLPLVNELLADLLRHPAWHIEPQALWELAVTNRTKPDWLGSLKKSPELQNLRQWLLQLGQDAPNQPITLTLEYLLGLRAGEHFTSPLSAYYANRPDQLSSDYIHGLSALRLLTQLVSEFSSINAGLDDLDNFIRVSRETNQIIADESVFVTGDHAVDLLTVHKAKGLEFDTVYIVDAVDNNWRPNRHGRQAPANLPLQPTGDDIDDYARLMFVAITRTKRSLIVCSYSQDSANKDVLTSPLISQAIDFRAVNDKKLSKPKMVLEQSLSWPHLNQTDKRRLLQPTLDAFRMSASSLLDFLDVSQGGPDYFFERHILRLPQATSPNMAFGTAIHYALEQAQLMANQDSLSTKQVLLQFEKSLLAQTLEHHEQQRYLTHGKNLLSSLLTSKTFYLPKGSLPEQTLADVRAGDAIIKGTIDRIDLRKDQIVIVDYKTGKPLSSFTTRAADQQVKAWRHKTQLTFYALLLRDSHRFKNNPTITGQMWYLEASKPSELVREYQPTKEEIDRLQKLAQIIWPRIINLDLPNTSQYTQDFAGILAFEKDLLDNAN